MTDQERRNSSSLSRGSIILYQTQTQTQTRESKIQKKLFIIHPNIYNLKKTVNRVDNNTNTRRQNHMGFAKKKQDIINQTAVIKSHQNLKELSALRSVPHLSNHLYPTKPSIVSPLFLLSTNSPFSSICINKQHPFFIFILKHHHTS